MMGSPSLEDQIKHLSRELNLTRWGKSDWEAYAHGLEALLSEARGIIQKVKDPNMEPVIAEFLVRIGKKQ